MLEILSEPLSFDFFQRGFIAIIIIGAISGVVGTYVVVRGMSFFADALAHTILPGVALGYTASGGNIGTPIFLGGMVSGILSAVIIAWLSRRGDIKEDTVIAIVFVSMFALGIAIISTSGSYAIDLTHILFGSILGVKNEDIIFILITSFIVILCIGLFYKELLVFSFDIELARALKLPVEMLRLLLLILIAIVIVSSLQTVGIALMLALLITPAAIAQLYFQRFHTMMLFSSLIGMLSGTLGFYLSYYINIPSGAAIVLMMSALFIVAYMGRTLLNWYLYKTKISVS